MDSVEIITTTGEHHYFRRVTQMFTENPTSIDGDTVNISGPFFNLGFVKETLTLKTSEDKIFSIAKSQIQSVEVDIYVELGSK